MTLMSTNPDTGIKNEKRANRTGARSPHRGRN